MSLSNKKGVWSYFLVLALTYWICQNYTIKSKGFKQKEVALLFPPSIIQLMDYGFFFFLISNYKYDIILTFDIDFIILSY